MIRKLIAKAKSFFSSLFSRRSDDTSADAHAPLWRAITFPVRLVGRLIVGGTVAAGAVLAGTAALTAALTGWVPVAGPIVVGVLTVIAIPLALLGMAALFFGAVLSRVGLGNPFAKGAEMVSDLVEGALDTDMGYAH